MKKVNKIFLLLIISLVIAMLFTACDTAKKDNNTDKDNANTEKDVIISFIVDGEGYKATTIKENDVVALPNNPTKEGYTFDGWYFDNNVWEEKITESTLFDNLSINNVFVYAKWTQNAPEEFTITYVSYCGTEIDDEVLETGSLVAIPQALSKEDYIFDGWYTSLDNGITLDKEWNFDEDSITENIILYAKWIKEIKVKPIAFANAVQEWDNATGEKSIIESYTYNTSLKIGVSTISLNTKEVVTRNYVGNQLKNIIYSLSLIEIEGITSILQAVRTILPVEYLPLIDVLIASDNISIENIADITIDTDENFYYLNVLLPLSKISDENQDVVIIDNFIVDKKFVDDFINMIISGSLKLDMISIFNLTGSTMVSKGENQLKTTYKSKDVLSNIVNALDERLNAFINDALDDVFYTIVDVYYDSLTKEEKLDLIDTFDLIKAFIEVTIDFIFGTTKAEEIFKNIFIADEGSAIATFNEEKLTDLEFNQNFIIAIPIKYINNLLELLNSIGFFETAEMHTLIRSLLPFLTTNGKIELNVSFSLISTLTY